MKKLLWLVALCVAILVSVSCKPAGKNTYTIEGKNSLYVGEVSNSIVVSNSSTTIPAEHITWDSSHTDVATVSYGGVINALSEGVTEISATFEDKGRVVTISKSLKTITLDTDFSRAPLFGYHVMGSASIALGATERFTVFHGDDVPAIVDSINWSSSDPSTLSIGATSGVATAIRLSSSVLISADIHDIYDNVYTIEYPVEVRSSAGYTIIGAGTLHKGQQIQLVLGSESGDLSEVLAVHWSSDNESAVTIQEDTGLMRIQQGSGSVSVSALIDTTAGAMVIDREFYLQDGAFILEYDLSESKSVELPFSKFRIIEQGNVEEFVLLDHSFTIDWGDGEETFIDTPQYGYRRDDFVHDFSSFSADRVRVLIYGDFIEVDHNGSFGKYLVDVKNWGNAAIVNDCADSHHVTLFHETSLKTFSAEDSPYLQGCMDGLFYGQSLFYGNLSSWDVSAVTSMNDMFAGARNFDGNLGSWDTSKVSSFNSMFQDAFSFQGVGLDRWKTSKATSMASMFTNASSLHADLRSWDVRSVRNFTSMFAGAKNFEGSGLGEWKVNAFAKYDNMFEGALKLQESLASWELLALPTIPVANVSMFKESGLRNPQDHPRGCTSACGVDHEEKQEE